MDATPSNNSYAEQPSIRRTFVTGVLLVIGAFVGVVFSAAPAFADEFVVGIVVGQTTSDTPNSTFMDGFQLAVDQSPDVSHPAGVEGGDHLGSMDVIMVVVEDVTEPDQAVAAVVDLIERDGAAIIVADVAQDVLASILGPVTESETMLIAMSDTGGADIPATPFFFAAAAQGRAGVLLTDRNPAFEEAFVAAYGRLPSESVTRGYVAGRLVDLSVEATDRDPSDGEALIDGLVAAIGSPSVQPEDNGVETDTTSPIAPAGSPAEPDSSAGIGRGLVAGIVLLIVVLSGWRIRMLQQQRRSFGSE